MIFWGRVSHCRNGQSSVAERLSYVGESHRWRVVALTFLLTLVLAPAPRAPSQEVAQTFGPILYREHLMSEDLIAEQGAGYLPMQRVRFEEAIEHRSKTSPATAARLVEVTYRARLTSEDVLVGTAQCHVSHDGIQPAPITLAPCGLAIGIIRWMDGDARDAEIPSGISPSGDFRAIVDRDGIFEFPWSLRGTRTSQGSIEFAVRLPAVPLNHFLVELPSHYVPRAASAIIERTSESPEITGNRVWKIEAASDRELSFQLDTGAPTTNPVHPIFVREASSYRLTSAGMELATTFHLDALTAPIRELVFDLPASMQVASATIADKPVAIEHVCSLTDQDVYRLSFPDAQRGTDVELVIVAVGPVTTNRSWQLPAVHLWDTTWQSGSAAIEIVEPLSLLSAAGSGRIARKVEPLPLPDRGELRQFQAYSSDGHLTVWLAENTQEFVADTGLSLRFAESILTGQLIADVQAIRGTTFALRALVQPGWIIDTVQTEPVEAFEAFQAAGSGQQSFDIKLKQALSVDRRVRLIIRGHRRSPVSNRSTNLAGMKFVRLQGVKNQSGVMALGVETPLRLSLTGDQEAQQVGARDLTVAETSRINVSPESVIFREESALNTVAVTQTPELPHYSAQVNIEARVDSQSLTQDYEFQIAPEGTHVARLMIRFANPSSTVPVWELVDAEENALSARQVDSSETSTEHQLWEITLIRPLGVPFRLRATWKSSLANETGIGLASVPEASSQTGIVRIFGTDGSPLDITAKNAQTLAIGRVADAEIQSLRGAYRFIPSQDASIYLRRSTTPHPLPLAWIWFAHLTSRVGGAGELQHEARLNLESRGLSSLPLDLPAGATSPSVMVDGVHIDLDVRDGDPRLLIPLPRGRRFPTVSIAFVTQAPSFRFTLRVPSVWPTTNLPCLKRRRDIWTPPGLQVAGQTAHVPTWDQRLFGFALLRRGKPSFNPFSIQDWRSLGEVDFLVPSDEVVDTSQIETAPGPWTTFPTSFDSTDSEAGWTRVTTPDSSEASEVLVYSRQALQACGWGLLLIVVGAFCSWNLSRMRLASLVTVAAAIVLLIPTDLLPLLRGFFYGSVLAFLFTWVPRRLSVPTRGSTGATSSFRGEPLPAATASFMVLTIATLAGNAMAQRPEVPAENKLDQRAVVHPVLIPVDDEQKPSGDYVYVPKTLFDELLRGSGGSHGPTFGPLITSAHYEVELTGTSELPESIQLRQLRATYELRDLSLNGLLKLPFLRDRVRITDVRIDDQPIPFTWSDDGRGIQIVSESAESRTLTVQFRPIDMTHPTGGIDVPIPVVPRSRVTIRSEFPLNNISLPSARGQVEQSAPNTITADLGPAAALRATWHSDSTPQRTVLDGEVAEILWMHVQANSAVVRAQFHFVFREAGASEFVDIEVDPRLRLLPGNGDAGIQELQLQGNRILRCPLAGPTAKEATMELAFSLSGGIGNSRVPHLSARIERHATKWLAISAGEGFESAVLPSDKVRPIAVTDFLRAWGRESETPQLAVALDDSDEAWQLSVRPSRQQISTDQQLEMILGHGQISFAYESVVVVEQGSLLQQRFRVPAGFEPREVVVIHDDVNRLLRWARVDSRTLTAFFTSPLSATFRVWIKGEIPLGRSGRVEVPVLAEQKEIGAVIPVNRVKILYRNDVQAKLENSPGLVADSRTTEGASMIGQGRQLATLIAKPGVTEEQRVQLNVTPNRPRLQGTLITALDNHDGRWWADVSLDLQIRGGYIDTLRLRFPNELEFPAEITPKVHLEEIVIPGHGERQLVVHLPNDENRSVALRLRCAIKEQDDELVRAPDIRLPDSNQLQRFIVLPKLIGHRPTLWDTSGLQAAELPPKLAAIAEKYAGANVYQIVGPHMSAQLKSTQPIQGLPRVHLADYRLHWSEDHHCQGLAAFDIEPGGLGDVTLVLPARMQVVNVTVGTIPVSTEHVADQRWRVPLGMTSLPQHVEVLFDGRCERFEQSSGIKTFHAPIIADLPCVETLWTIQGPTHYGEGMPLLAQTRADRLQLANQRLDTANKLFRSAPIGVGREGLAAADPWRTNREQWVKQLERDVFEARSADFQSGLVPRSRKLPSALAVPRYDVAGAWSLPSIEGATPVYGALRGSAASFEVSYSDFAWRNLRRRLLAVLAMFVGIAVLYRVRKIDWIRAVSLRYPQFAVALTGFAWWMWLAPSVAGLAVMVLAAAISLRPPWKTKAA